MDSTLLKRLLTGFLLLLVFNLNAQEWKQAYDEAVAAYQDQKYDDALVKVNRAYALAKTLEPKNQAYTLQLLTSICLESNRLDDGLARIVEEEELFKKIEGPGSPTYAEALRKHSLLLMQKGRYADALNICQASLDALKVGQKENSLTSATLLAEQGELYALLGKLPEAKKSLDQSLTQLAKFPEAGDDYLNALTVSADIDRKLKDLPAAEKKYKRVLEIMEQNEMQKTAEYSEVKKALSGIALLQAGTADSVNAIQGESLGYDQKATQLLKIAVDLHNRKDYEKAIETYRAAEQAAEEGALANNTAFSIYLNFGTVLLETKDPVEASPRLNKAWTLCQKLYSAGTIEYVLMDFAMADLRLQENNIKTAIELYMRAGGSAGLLPPALRKQLALKASIQLLNEYESESAQKFLLSIGADRVDAQSVKEQPELIVAYAQTLLRSNQLGKAQSVLQHAIPLATEATTRVSLELALVQVLERKGQMARALNLLNAMQVRPTSSENQVLEITYQKTRMQQLMGHYQEAEKGYQNIITALGKRQGFDDQLQMQCYNSLAVLLTQLGNYDEAERLYTELLKKNGLPPDFILTIRENLSAIYEESLQLDKARALMEQVVTTERLREGDHSPELAITLQNLATLNQKTGDLTSAKKLLEEAMKIDAETVGTQSAVYATKMANLGVVQQQLGNLPEARKLFQQALTIHEKTLGKEHPDYMFNAYNLAVSLQQAKDPGAAAPLYKEVASFYRKQIHELFPAMSEKEKAAFFNKINEVILAYLDFAVENGQKIPGLRGELYDFRLSTKALLYNASVKIRNSILSSGDTLMLARFTEWQKAKEDLGILSQLTALERIQAEDEVQSLRLRINELERFLSERSASFNTEAQQTTVDWRKVKSRLQKGQAAIEMIRLRLNLKNDSVIYAALIIRPEFETPEMVVFRNGRKMEGRDFFYYRNSIKYQLDNERSYQVYWKPLEEKLAGVNTVFLSPDGVYNKINVMTLFDTHNNKYVLESTKIRLVNNTRELLNPVKSSTSQLQAALFGRPDFGQGQNETQPASTNRSPSSLQALVMNGIADLPGTEEEVNKINELLQNQKWQSTIFLGDKTTEQAVKLQKDIRVLHIATHGFFIPLATEKDPVMLSPDLRQPGKNPLLRSGLILSGAQRSVQSNGTNKNPSEDGILTAYEVMNLNLDATELVILSACETGAGEIKNGEGIFGLQRAFLLAGAGSLVMSLWKVDDEATQELMVEFYRQWLVTHDKYEALHKTMLVMKSKMAQPFYWGGFAMIGIN